MKPPDWEKFKSAIYAQVGKPYKYGAKWPLGDPNPEGPIDCSGFVRWAYSRIGIYIPDGSHAQFLSSDKTKLPGLGDLGFFKRPGENVHHVGILYDQENVIEARGDRFNAVIMRPRKVWEAWKEFVGWNRLDAVLEIESKLLGG